MADWLERNKAHLLVFAFNFLCNLIVVGLAVIFLRWPRAEGITIEPPPPTPTVTPTLTPSPLAVYVSGEVERPAVYTLPPGSRMSDALAAAGGPTAKADLTRLNLARRLQDEEQVYVPAKGESPPPSPIPPATPPPATSQAPSSPAEPPGKININTATAAELESLPRIGPALAERIIEYREANGPFASIEEIMNVKGIGPATFEQIKDMITVE